MAEVYSPRSAERENAAGGLWLRLNTTPAAVGQGTALPARGHGPFRQAEADARPRPGQRTGLPDRFARYTQMAEQCLTETNRLKELLRKVKAEDQARNVVKDRPREEAIALPFNQLS